MRLPSLLCLFLTLAGSAAWSQGGQARPRDFVKTSVKETAGPKKRALVIGIGDYIKAQDLNCTVNDARHFHDFLVNSWGFPEANVMVVADPESGKPAAGDVVPEYFSLRDQVDRFLDSIREGDEVVFFYSGHGVRVDSIDYLVPNNGDPEKVGDTCISITKIRDRLEQSPAQRALMFIDACRQIVKPGTRAVGVVSRVGEEPPPKEQHLAAFYSCRPGQFSREHPRLRMGVFTYFLQEALGGAEEAAGTDGVITADSLTQYVRGHVQDYVQHQLGGEQTPFSLCSYGALPLVRVPQKAPPPVDPRIEARRHVEEAFRLLQAGKSLEAAGEAREALKLEPENAEALFINGSVLLKTGQFADAVQALTQVKRLRPDYPGLEEQLDAARKERIPGQAQPIPTSQVVAEAEKQLAARELKLAEVSANLALFIRADATTAERSRALLVLGQVHEQLGRLGEAVEAYTEALRLVPGTAAARDGLDRLRKLTSKQDTQGKVNEAFQLLGQGEPRSAELRAREALAADPESGRAHLALGRALLATGREAEAESELRLAKEKDPTLQEAARLLDEAAERRVQQSLGEKARQADAAAASGDAATAERLAGEVLAAGKAPAPAAGLAHWILGRGLQAKGQEAEALREYQEALRLEPGLEKARAAQDELIRKRGDRDVLALAGEALVQGNPAQAEARAREVIARAPANPAALSAAYYALGGVYRASSPPRLADALDQFQEAKRLAGQINGPALVSADAVDSALKQVREARDREQARPLVQQAYRSLTRGYYVDALTTAQKALALDPQNAEAQGIAGNALVWLGSAPAAEQALQKARDLARSGASPASDPKKALALAYVGEGSRDWRDAKDLRDRDARKPDPALRNQAKELFSRAERAFQETLKLDSSSLLAENNLAAAYNELGRYPEAAGHAERARAQAPDFAFAYANLGTALYGQKKHAEAGEQFAKAAELAPQNPQFRLALAYAYNAQGKKNEAKAAAQKALDLGLRVWDDPLFDRLGLK